MKKFIIIAVIGLLGIGALFGSAEEDVPQETETVEETEAESEETEEAKRKQEEREAKQKAEAELKAKEEREAKQKAEEDRKQEEKKAKEEQERKAKEEEEAKQKAEEEEAETQAKAEEAENADAEELYYQIMQENLGMYVSVEFDEENKIFNLTPTDQDLIDAISMLPNGVGHEEWGTMVDALASMSDTGIGLVGEGYTINLVNPLNHENIILWIIDGEIVYNVVDEL